MSRMIPSYISSNVKSYGEKQIFKLFKDAPGTDDWIALHSLNVPKPLSKLYGEIDFVVLAPGLGIFCLEVKSGTVKRKDGVWIISDKSGRSYSSNTGPIKQAEDGMFDLKEAIKNKFGKDSREAKFVCGYGVMFPHIIFSIEDEEIERWHVYDRRLVGKPIRNYIEKLSNCTSKKLSNAKWFNKVQSFPNKDDAKRLLNFLRPDFDIYVSKKQRLEDIEERITEFTKEQYKCLDQLEDNDRLLFQGPAGTGKTVIALESAKRSICDGKRTLFLCFNKLLASWISEELSGYMKEYDFYAGSFHDFLEKIVKNKEEIEKSSKDLNEYYKIDLPLCAIEAIENGDIRKFDKVIIDEGQDIIRSEYLDVIDLLLVNGMKNGQWDFYCDFKRQNIYLEDISYEKMIKMLKDKGDFSKFKLNINCRNTKPIAKEISDIFKFNKPIVVADNIEGIPVEYKLYKDRDEEVKKLEEVLLKLREEKIPPTNITILSPYRKNSCINDIDKAKFNIANISEDHSLFLNRSSLTFGTIYKFKGMENFYIIIIDIGSEINKKQFKNLLYVGMSRAKFGLIMLVNKELKSKLDLLKENQIN